MAMACSRSALPRREAAAQLGAVRRTASFETLDLLKWNLITGNPKERHGWWTVQ